MTHAQKRLKERYEIHPSKGLMKKIRLWIIHDDNRVKAVKPAKWGFRIYMVRIGKRIIPVVYGGGKIRTFLPQEAV